MKAEHAVHWTRVYTYVLYNCQAGEAAVSSEDFPVTVSTALRVIACMTTGAPEPSKRVLPSVEPQQGSIFVSPARSHSLH